MVRWFSATVEPVSSGRKLLLLGVLLLILGVVFVFLGSLLVAVVLSLVGVLLIMATIGFASLSRVERELTRCSSCGKTFDTKFTICPHCGTVR